MGLYEESFLRSMTLRSHRLDRRCRYKQTTQLLSACRHPGPGRVTSIARLIRRDVVSRLAGCRHAIVTSGASTGGNISVIKRRRDPGVGPMTGITCCAGWDVIGRLTGCGHAVVAAGAATGSSEIVAKCSG